MNNSRVPRRLLGKTFALCATVVLLGYGAPADAAPIAGMLQGAIFAKALGYDQTVSKRGGTPKIVVLAASKDDAHAARVADGARKAKVDAVVVTRGEVAGALAGAAALYVDGAEFDAELSSLCVKHQVLSLSEAADAARAGRIAVGLEQRGSSLGLVIHLARARSEGHQLSSQLLKLAEVIR